MTRARWIIAGITAFAVTAGAVALVWALQEGEPSNEQLEAQASDSTAPRADRERATLKLGDRGRPAVPQMRNLARTDEPVVRSIALRCLGEQYDYDSMDILLDAMLRDDSGIVRCRAAEAIGRMTGMRPAGFDASTPPAARARIVEALRQQWEALKASSALPEFKQKLDRHFGEMPQ